MKRDKRKKINSKNEKMKQQELEEEKKRLKKKKERIKEETRKTMLGLVIEGRKSFYYEL